MTLTTHARDVSILAALADPIRLEIVKRLSKGQEVSGVDLAKGLGISRALLCHHAGILVGAGVATRRRVGQTGYLRLDAQRLQRCLAKLGPRSASTRGRTKNAGKAQRKPRPPQKRSGQLRAGRE